MFQLGSKSRKALDGVHPDLVRVVELAITLTEQDFSVIQGLRTKDQQQTLVAKGNSWTLNSRHLTGHAVDLAPYPLDWNSRHKFHQIKDAMFKASTQLGIPVRWGGDWNRNGSDNDEIKRGTWDGGHFELERGSYP